jgi:hypothetical protein
MKQIFIVSQSKGGSGKSFFTTLMAHKYEEETTVGFYDMDNSTLTLSSQIAFIKNFKNRILKASILNENGRIERDKMVKLFEALAEDKFEKIFIDMGATESDQLYQFLLNDLNCEDLKEFMTEISCDLSFIIPVSGNTATKATSNYAKLMFNLVSDFFKIFIVENLELTDNDSSIEIGNILGVEAETIKFGKTEGDTERGKRVVNMMKEGKSATTLNILTRGKMKSLLEPLNF